MSKDADPGKSPPPHKTAQTLRNPAPEPVNSCGPRVALLAHMSFSHAVDRVRAHFDEMPGLELTIPQTVRLVGFGVDDCRYVIDALVDVGFLRWTARRTIVRTDSVWGREAESSYVSVRRREESNRSVRHP